MDHKRRQYINRQDSDLSSTSDFITQPEKRQPVRKLVTPSSSLEIVDGDQFGASGFNDDRNTPDGSLRSWSRSSFGSVPPRSDSSLSRRTLTPTKQVSLQAVRRREESSEPFVDHIDVTDPSSRVDGPARRAWDVNDDDVDFSQLSIGDHRQAFKNNRLMGGSNLINGSSPATPMDGEATDRVQSLKGEGDNRLASKKHRSDKHRRNDDDDDSDDEDDDDDDDDDDGEGGDEDKDENEKLKAPTELLMEFIDCLMKKDYPNASKLCKMILLYEPENEEALKFQPLIEEKMALDAEADAEGEGSSDDDDDDDDDDSDEDSSSDDDDDSSDDDDENDDGDDDDDDVDKYSRLEPSSSFSQSREKTSQDPRIAGANTSKIWKPAS